MFSDSMASPKIKRTKIMCIINDNAVRGRLSENYLTRKSITRNICDAKYSRFTVYTITKIMPYTVSKKVNSRDVCSTMSTLIQCKSQVNNLPAGSHIKA